MISRLLPPRRLPRHLIFVGAMALSIAATPGFAAGIYTEVGDAGELIGSAQPVTGAGGSITAIRGTLSSGADLFSFTLTAGQNFSADTTSSSIAYDDFDTELFLFDSSGKGLAANDDSNGPQSLLSYSVASSGTYYLAIAGAGYLPTSVGGEIFASSGGFLSTAGTPTGPGGALALSGWKSVSSESGDYEIRLTGATIAAVPEPEAFALFGAGLAAVGFAARRRRSAG